MPLVLIKTRPSWHKPGRNRVYVDQLAHSMPAVVSEAWAQMPDIFWGEPNPAGVLPDIVPPFGIVTEATPDVEVTVMPNYTPERFEAQHSFRRQLHLAIDKVASELAQKCGVTRPSIDLNVSFVMGCGLAMMSDGKVDASWPDKLLPG